MKSKLLVVLLTFFCLSAIANEPKTQLVVWQVDGSYVVYPLDERPITTFSDDNLVITTTRLRIEYPMAEVSYYSFDRNTDEIGGVHHKGVTVKQTESEIIVYNLQKGEDVSLYSMDGRLLCSVQSVGQKQTRLPLKRLTPGTYIVKTANISYKILKR